jgi:MoxR-like ATPase
MENIIQWNKKVRDQISSVILGKEEVISCIIISLLCGGHVLLEDVPGVGKTILARALAKTLGGTMKRIQCTPDILPSDILGVSVYRKEQKKFIFHPGPVFTNILLVDEINRASPRTQSALLEAMGTGTVSIEGKEHRLPSPFFIIATQNPVEFEGTFNLPEAQKDRFFMTLSLGYPDQAAEENILTAQNRQGHPVDDLRPVTDTGEFLKMKKKAETIPVPEKLTDSILDIARMSREDSRLEMGISPRGARALFDGIKAAAAVEGRQSARTEDLVRLAPAILKKRIFLKPETHLRKITGEDIIRDYLESALSGERSSLS